MCLILCAYRAHPRYELVLAANRDEFFGRPTAPAGWWSDRPGILAGRDLEQGGSWLAVSRNGRFAAVTNVRDRLPAPADAPSRGGLVADFVADSREPAAYLSDLEPERYDGFNLLCGAPGQLAYLSNRDTGVRPLEPGLYGLSNALLDTPWFKVERGKRRLSELLRRHPAELPADELFELLSDRELAPDDRLPDTGFPLELERQASAIFTEGGDYGTRCSTVVTVDRQGTVTFEERSVPSGAVRGFRFTVRAG